MAILQFNPNKSGHPLVKNSNGTLRIGRRWRIAPNSTHYYSEAMIMDQQFYSAALADALTASKGASSWITGPSDGTFMSAFLGVAFTEDYPYFDPDFMWASHLAGGALYSFSIPSEIRSRTLKQVFITLESGGSTLLEWGSDDKGNYYPAYVNPWNHSGGLAGFKFHSSSPSKPSNVGSPHTTTYFAQMTSAAVGAGAPIVYDGSGYWTAFYGGMISVSTPSSVVSLCQGLSTIYLTAFPYAIGTFSIPSDYSRALHVQNSRSGAPYLFLFTD